jgi:hypothetical protein
MVRLREGRAVSLGSPLVQLALSLALERDLAPWKLPI